MILIWPLAHALHLGHFHSMSDLEDRYFRKQLDLARELDMVVMIHTPHRDKKRGEDFAADEGLRVQGVIHRHAFEGGGARFEAADMPHHDHIIDLDTGDVMEFRSDKIEQLQAEIAREYGYDLVHHRLELYCRKRKDS